MRLWSISPEYLDVKGLVALWREGLLAKSVLEGKTKGYKNHPQLIRFKNFTNPLLAINSYLSYVFLVGKDRGYSFDMSKIEFREISNIIPVSKGQVEYEFKHLLNKLIIRDRSVYDRIHNLTLDSIKLNPVFYIVDGGVEYWEKFR